MSHDTLVDCTLAPAFQNALTLNHNVHNVHAGEVKTTADDMDMDIDCDHGDDCEGRAEREHEESCEGCERCQHDDMCEGCELCEEVEDGEEMDDCEEGGDDEDGEGSEDCEHDEKCEGCEVCEHDENCEGCEGCEEVESGDEMSEDEEVESGEEEEEDDDDEEDETFKPAPEDDESDEEDACKPEEEEDDYAISPHPVFPASSVAILELFIEGKITFAQFASTADPSLLQYLDGPYPQYSDAEAAAQVVIDRERFTAQLNERMDLLLNRFPLYPARKDPYKDHRAVKKMLPDLYTGDHCGEAVVADREKFLQLRAQGLGPPPVGYGLPPQLVMKHRACLDRDEEKSRVRTARLHQAVVRNEKRAAEWRAMGLPVKVDADEEVEEGEEMEDGEGEEMEEGEVEAVEEENEVDSSNASEDAEEAEDSEDEEDEDEDVYSFEPHPMLSASDNTILATFLDHRSSYTKFTSFASPALLQYLDTSYAQYPTAAATERTSSDREKFTAKVYELMDLMLNRFPLYGIVHNYPHKHTFSEKWMVPMHYQHSGDTRKAVADDRAKFLALRARGIGPPAVEEGGLPRLVWPHRENLMKDELRFRGPMVSKHRRAVKKAKDAAERRALGLPEQVEKDPDL